ncbi:MAG TPA: hypothetical protein PK165_06530 [bacterium]|nr:hypothetical protein [bacterium]HPO52467.1 hypothetical protein [bacterium]
MKSYRRWHATVDNFPAERKTAPCRVSVPFTQEECRHLYFSVERPDGSEVPAQSRVIRQHNRAGYKTFFEIC